LIISRFHAKIGNRKDNTMTPESIPDTTVFDIADWFLAKANDENKPLKPMKLQKLVYFAYGWRYAYFDKPLFPETIYAWRHGPVVKELYDRFKPFKGQPIIEGVTPKKLDVQVETILDSVWKAYGQYSDVHLSDITHRPDSPWASAYRSDEWYAVMTPESIRKYFKELLEKRTHAGH